MVFEKLENSRLSPFDSLICRMEKHSQLRQISFFILLVIIGVYLGAELSRFLTGFLGALTLYFFLRKPIEYLVLKRKFSAGVSAFVLVIASFILVLVPLGFLLGMFTSRLAGSLQNSQEAIDSCKIAIAQLEHFVGFEILTKDSITSMGLLISNAFSSMVGVLASSFISLFVMYILLYFMLRNYREIEAGCYLFLPLQSNHISWVAKELKTLILSNALGLPATALVQGFLAAICYSLLGINDVFFWFCITAVASVIPLLGASVAYIPLSLMLYLKGDHTEALILLSFGLIILTLTDNLLRLYIQKRLGNVHPLITIFGVIVGVQLFGFIGLIFGPIIISMFFLLIKIYRLEFPK